MLRVCNRRLVAATGSSFQVYKYEYNLIACRFQENKGRTLHVLGLSLERVSTSERSIWTLQEVAGVAETVRRITYSFQYK